MGGVGKQQFIGLLTAAALVISEAGGLMAAPLNALAAGEPEAIEDHAEAERIGSDADLALSGQDEVPADEAEAGAEAEALYSDGVEDAVIVEDSETDDQSATLDADVVDADDNIFGDAPFNKDKYYVTFTVNNADNASQPQYTASYELTNSSAQPLNQFSFYNALMSDVDSYLAQSDRNMRLVGWSVYTDGFNVSHSEDYDRYYYSAPVYLNSDGYSYDYGNYSYEYDYDYDAEDGDKKQGNRTFELDGKKDYHFVAHLSKAAADELYVSVIPSVHFDGRAHVAIGTKTSVKKQAADLRIRIYSGGSDCMEALLKPGTDYTLAYKNNTNASMKLVREGEEGNPGSYEPTYTDNSQRPTVIVTGKGTYNGFSAEVYFDILPTNLGETSYEVEYLDVENSSPYDSNYYYYSNYYAYPRTIAYSYAAGITGFKSSYQLKNGKVTGMPKQKVTKSFANSGYDSNGKFINKLANANLTLVENKDYKVELYKWDESGNKWTAAEVNDPARITQAGDYLYLIRGIGNYCGAMYDYGRYVNYGSASYSGNIFNTGENGSPCPVRELSYSTQFRVTDDLKYDLSLAKVTIKKKSVPYTGSAVGRDDFQISVKNKAGETLAYGEDYTLSFQMKGNQGHARIAQTGMQPEYDYGETVIASNDYLVIILPADGSLYFAANTKSTVKIQGLKLKANMFKLSAKKLPAGQNATWDITAAGTAQKLTRTDSSDPYYVSSTNSYSGYLGSASKVTTIIGGALRCGDAIDPTSTVKLIWGHSSATLQDLINAGLIKFTISEYGDFHVSGAVPESLTVITSYENYYESWNLYPGALVYVDVDNIGWTNLQLSYKGNTKLDGTATISAKAVDGNIKGSATIGTFKVRKKTVENFSESWEYGSVKAVADSALKGSGSLDKPTATLYQYYQDAKTGGEGKWVPVGTAYYTCTKGDDVGSAGIAAEVIINNGSTEGFDFGEGVTVSEPYALYDKAINIDDIDSVTIGDRDYKVVKGVVQDYEAVFTGVNIWLNANKITLKDTDGTVLFNWNDYDENRVWDNKTNISVGTGNTSFTFRYNQDQDRYPYGGTVALKFKIVAADGIKL